MDSDELERLQLDELELMDLNILPEDLPWVPAYGIANWRWCAVRVFRKGRADWTRRSVIGASWRISGAFSMRRARTPRDATAASAFEAASAPRCAPTAATSFAAAQAPSLWVMAEVCRRPQDVNVTGDHPQAAREPFVAEGSGGLSMGRGPFIQASRRARS